MIKNLKNKRSIKIKSYLVSSLLTLSLVTWLIPAGVGFAQVAQPSMISAGDYHSLALKSDGTAWAWGYNNGALGDGTTIQKLTPVPVSGLTGVAAIAAGAYHSLALKSDGTVWAWGYNGVGALGDGTTINRLTPVQVSGLTGVAAIAAGDNLSLALKSDGTVWAWGYNGTGALGDGTTINRLTPVPVSGLTGVAAIAAGYRHSLALKSDGTVWAWGANLYGQLGDGTTIQKLTPVPVSGLTGVAAIAAGNNHSLAVKSDGTVWAWGYNGVGGLGDGTTIQKLTPVPVSGLTGVAAIAAGNDHSLAVKSDGTAWAWGYNNGALGDGTTINRLTPVQVSGLTGVAAIAAGYNHSLAVKSDGTVWAWGANLNGQLGDGTTIRRFTPVQVLFPAAADTQAPTVPSNLVANAISSTQINLSWTASTDNVGVTGYLVERCQGAGCSNFSQIAAFGNVTSYSDTGLTPSTSYNYRIRATDAVNNFSGYSTPANATTLTPPDTTPPDTTINSAIDGNSNPVSNGGPTNSTSITFTFSGTDNVAVTSFECSLDGAVFSACTTPKNYTSLVLGSHTFQVRAKDAANNVDPTPASFSWTITVDADNDGVTNSVEQALTGSPTGLTVNATGVEAGTLSGVMLADGSMQFSGVSSTFLLSQAFFVLPPGSTVPSGTLTLTAQVIQGTRQALTLTGAVLPAGTTKTAQLKASPKICIVDSPTAGAEVVGTLGNNCTDSVPDFRVKMDCPGAKSITFLDGLRNYTCTVAGGLMTVAGLQHTAISGFEDADNDGVDDAVDQCSTIPGTPEFSGCTSSFRVSVELVDASVRPAVRLDQALTTKVFDASPGSCADNTGVQPMNYAQIFSFCAPETTKLETNSPGTPSQNLDSDLVGINVTTGSKLVLVESPVSNDGSKVYVGFVANSATGQQLDLGFENTPTSTFTQTSYFAKDNRGDWHASRRQAITGSLLEVISPMYTIWSGIQQFYPFIFISDSNWTVDVCAQVPHGYDILGVYDESGALMTTKDCVQAFVNKETKVVAFDVTKTGSPPKWDLNARLLAKGPNGKVQTLDLNVPSVVMEKSKGKPFLATLSSALSFGESLWTSVIRYISGSFHVDFIKQAVGKVAQPNNIGISRRNLN